MIPVQAVQTHKKKQETEGRTGATNLDQLTPLSMSLLQIWFAHVVLPMPPNTWPYQCLCNSTIALAPPTVPPYERLTRAENATNDTATCAKQIHDAPANDDITADATNDAATRARQIHDAPAKDEITAYATNDAATSARHVHDAPAKDEITAHAGNCSFHKATESPCCVCKTIQYLTRKIL